MKLEININKRITNNEKPQVKKLTALKVISALLFIVTFIILLSGFIDVINNDADSQKISLVFYFAIIVLVFGIIGNGLSLIPALQD